MMHPPNTAPESCAPITPGMESAVPTISPSYDRKSLQKLKKGWRNKPRKPCLSPSPLQLHFRFHTPDFSIPPRRQFLLPEGVVFVADLDRRGEVHPGCVAGAADDLLRYLHLERPEHLVHHRPGSRADFLVESLDSIKAIGIAAAAHMENGALGNRFPVGDPSVTARWAH